MLLLVRLREVADQRCWNTAKKMQAERAAPIYTSLPRGELARVHGLRSRQHRGTDRHQARERMSARDGAAIQDYFAPTRRLLGPVSCIAFSLPACLTNRDRKFLSRSRTVGFARGGKRKLLVRSTGILIIFYLPNACVGLDATCLIFT